jgi:hypothetical protein
MANEITVGIDFHARKGSYLFHFRPQALRVDLTNAVDSRNVASIGTAWTGVSVSPGVATAGWSIFRNLSTGAQYVDVATGSTSSPSVFARLYPGEIALLPLGQTTLSARAQTDGTTAAVPLLSHIIAR